MKYILYARKSTEEDDRQVLSIQAQLEELQEYAAKEKLEIVASFQEAKTAKEPGEKHRLEPYFAKPPILFCPQNPIRISRRAKRGEPKPLAISYMVRGERVELSRVLSHRVLSPARPALNFAYAEGGT